MAGKSGRTRILHLISSNFVGGPEKQILGHLKHVDFESYDVRVGSFMEGNFANDFLAELQRLKICATVAVNQKSMTDFSPILALRNYIVDNEIHGLVTHGYKSNIYGSIATIGTSVVHCMYVRGWTAENRKILIFNRLEKFFLKRADLVATVANAKVGEILSLGVDRKKIRCIYNAVEMAAIDSDDGSLHIDFGFDSKEKVVIAAGRLSPEKGHSDLLRSIALLRDRGMPIRCVIFGDGPEKANLDRMVNQLELREIVVFGGFEPGWKRYLASADAVVNPSLSEVMPNVVLESLILGCPVVATDVGGVRELIPSEEYGWVVPPREPTALADAIAHCFGSLDTIRIQEKARAHIVENFNFQKQAEELAGL